MLLGSSGWSVSVGGTGVTAPFCILLEEFHILLGFEVERARSESVYLFSITVVQISGNQWTKQCQFLILAFRSPTWVSRELMSCSFLGDSGEESYLFSFSGFWRLPASLGSTGRQSLRVTCLRPCHCISPSDHTAGKVSSLLRTHIIRGSSHQQVQDNRM